jgi:hypothetical protein
LYQLFEADYEKVKAVWEERFEKTHGFWRGFVDDVVARYLDCGTAEAGFARLKCLECGSERLLTFSCRQRGLCPSCDAKRAAAFAAFLHDEVLEEVPHAMWVFTIPKMLRVYFLHYRELLGELSRAAYETVKELMGKAVLEEEHLRPGMVSVVQTFGDQVRFHPHLHVLCSRGGWNARGEWVPLPYVDTRKAEELFRHRVLRLLKDKDLLSEERIELLLSWKTSGFSIDESVRIPAGEKRMLEHVVRYMLRSPVSLSRTRWEPGSREVFYTSKGSHDEPEQTQLNGQSIDPLEFIARVITQIPDPRRHLVFYYGHYSNVARGLRKKRETQDPQEKTSARDTPQPEPVLTPAQRTALRRRWAELIRRVYEVDPLICPRCEGQLPVISFITQPSVIRRILEHLKEREQNERAPPRQLAVSP